MFWNKTLLKWEDPCFAQKFIAKHLRFGDYLLEFGKFGLKLGIGTYIVFLFLSWLRPRGVFSVFDLEILIIALFVVGSFWVLWLILLAASRLSKPQISLREKDIYYMSVEGGFVIPYKKLESFSINRTNLEEAEFFVLTVKDWDGNESFIEIDPKINNESIIELLKSKNIQMKAPLLYPS
jgi:hypothetical protein